jgi:hypothetical protein
MIISLIFVVFCCKVNQKTNKKHRETTIIGKKALFFLEQGSKLNKSS